MRDDASGAGPNGTKACRTRAAILAAAERVFAEKGYAAARLADVAAAVGLRRASLLYHVRGKRDLYDTVLRAVLEDLLDCYREVLAVPAPASRRIEAIIDAWVGFVGARPTVARLLLWEAAEGARVPAAAAAGRGAAIVAALVGVVEEGQRAGSFRPIDPLHLIVTLLGATVFFLTTTTRLAPAWPFDPLSPQQLAAHRAELLEVTRRLLGTVGEGAVIRNGDAEWAEAGASI
jgi:TetR/AcrR family transcriptional regulator